MVKGNWERRVERAAKQKAAKRDAAAAKAKGQLVDPLDILNAIFLKDPDASVWVAGQGNKLCAAYFRNGDCPNRRCKWSHAETLAPWSPSATDATTEPPLEQVPTVAARLDGVVPKAEYNSDSVLAPVPEGVVARVLDWCSAYRAGAAAATCRALRRAVSLSVGVRAQKDAARPRLLAARRRRVLRMARSVRFAGATVDGRRALAYDAEQPDVFRAFSRPARSLPRPARKKAPAARPFNSLLGEAAAARAVAAVIGALPDAGAAAVAATSKRLRALTKADDDYRRRRRRGLDARTAQRKKKGKRRQGKDTRKKDEFARGQ
mmetsp:Transcript_23457/g.61331  ORF Transcript_23457/g.61331 Transcript_23457/m.61331 type:complete len:320 (-) Transcript_23457:61-1020(-)